MTAPANPAATAPMPQTTHHGWWASAAGHRRLPEAPGDGPPYSCTVPPGHPGIAPLACRRPSVCALMRSGPKWQCSNRPGRSLCQTTTVATGWAERPGIPTAVQYCEDTGTSQRVSRGRPGSRPCRGRRCRGGGCCRVEVFGRAGALFGRCAKRAGWGLPFPRSRPAASVAGAIMTLLCPFGACDCRSGRRGRLVRVSRLGGLCGFGISTAP
jgi:hypothetical protein